MRFYRSRWLWSSLHVTLGGVAGLIASIWPVALVLSIGLFTTVLLSPGTVIAFAWDGLWVFEGLIPAGYGLIYSAVALVFAVTSSIFIRRYPNGQVMGSVLRHSWPQLLFGVLVIINFIVAKSDSETITRIRQLFYELLLYLTASFVLGSIRNRRHYLATIAALGCLTATAGIVWVREGGPAHVSSVALGVNPIILAQFAGLGFVILLSAAIKGARRYWATYGSLAALCLAGVIATGSRGPFAACLIAGLVLVFFDRRSSYRLRLLTITLVSPVAGWSLLNLGNRVVDIEYTAGGRWEAWAIAFRTAIDNPILGAGAGNYALGAPNLASLSYPHNIFLQAGAEYGLFAMLLMVFMVLSGLVAGNDLDRAVIVFATVCVTVSGELGTTHIWWAALALAASTTARRMNSRSRGKDKCARST